jgi:Uma2 family endonuclease
MSLTLQTILNSPRARLLVDAAQEKLSDESDRRNRFRDEKNEKEKSEWINGEAFVHSPAKWEHNKIVIRAGKLLDTIAQVNKLGEVTVEKCMIGLTRNDLEPDVCFWPAEVAKTFTADQMIFPAPALVIEVLSPSTEHNDRVIKADDYAAHGVREYWIIDPEAQTVEQFLLNDSAQYDLRAKTSNGTLTSVAMSGAIISVRALFDDAENLAAIRAAIGQ